jgi:hypothetical protein
MKRQLVLLTCLFLTSCASDKNLDGSYNILKNTSIVTQKNNQGPNSTGGIFRISDKDGIPLANTKFKVFSLKEDNLNPIIEENTNTNGEANISAQTITPEIIKEIKNNTIKLVLKAYKDGIEIPLNISNIEFTSDNLITISAKAEAPKAVEVRLSQKSLNLNAGTTSELLADVLMSDRTKTSGITWSSSDETVVKVVNGKLSALKKGVSIITASSISDLDINNKVTVTVVESNSISIIKIIDPKTKAQLNETIKIKPIENFQLQAISVFSDGSTSTNVIWKSSDESIVSIGKNSGLITGVSKGKALITALSSEDISKSYSIEVVVE